MARVRAVARADDVFARFATMPMKSLLSTFGAFLLADGGFYPCTTTANGGARAHTPAAPRRPGREVSFGTQAAYRWLPDGDRVSWLP
ncbi:hypothetical protein GCM10027259_45010 [Micromonospora palomenae]